MTPRTVHGCPELDASQQAAAGLQAEERQIVIAGPGAGKSEVVGALARNLVEDGIHPESILVISFSRAAVDVVRRRTADVVDEGRQVDVTTIDSLAARVIRDLADDDVPFTGYDHNVEVATRLLREADHPVFEDVDHVVVDEVQDVVGVRAEFVKALLTRGVRDDTGFTVLGDPLQSIYGFAEKNLPPGGAERLLVTLQERFHPTVRQLEGEYRARTPDARRAGQARSDLMRATGEARLGLARGLLADLAPLGELDDAVVDDIRDWRGTTALLCDTNARAALVADHLMAAGLPVETAQSTARPTLAPWLSTVLAGRSQGIMTQDEFLAAAGDAGAPHPEDAWRHLVVLSDSRRGLDVGRLLDRLAGRAVPPELARRPETSIVTSTVHRAKGLEFDNVVLVDPDAWNRKGTDPDDVARLLFVAATRARCRLTTTRGPAVKRWSKGRPPGGRWEIRPFPRAVPEGVILDPGDLWPSAGPAPTPPVGTAVTWSRAEIGHLDAEGDEFPAWNACVDGQIIAVTGLDFGRYMRTYRKVDRFELTGGRIHGYETRVAASADGRPALRTMPRIAGPLTWEDF